MEKMAAILILPWPPSINHYYEPNRKTGTKRISDAGKVFRQYVALRVKQQKLQGAFLKPKRLAVTVFASPPDRIRRDLDNILKPLQDACTKADLWTDDCQIDRLSIIRCPVIRGGEIELSVEIILEDEGGKR